METKHTEGPWELLEVRDGSIMHLCPVGPDGVSLLTVVHNDDVPFGAVFLEADARLIAAAPDMIEALREASHMFMGEYPGHPTTQKILAAIAKATGGECFTP